MDPLDSTAILVGAVESLLRPSPANPPAAGRPAFPRVQAAESIEARPSQRESKEAAISRQTSAPTPGLAADNPRATIRKAQELLQIAATDGASPILSRRIAAAAYLAEAEAQRELARMRRERPAGTREWLA